MRIVAGKFAGRHLTSPNDFRVRPTGETVRVALMRLLRNDLEGARIIDLFAGTGALGLEALSRGGKYVDFVEFRPSSLHALKANIAALGVREKTRVYKKDALPFAGALPSGKFDIAFAGNISKQQFKAWSLWQIWQVMTCLRRSSNHAVV